VSRARVSVTCKMQGLAGGTERIERDHGTISVYLFNYLPTVHNKQWQATDYCGGTDAARNGERGRTPDWKSGI
jgi:hypothetical protein